MTSSATEGTVRATRPAAAAGMDESGKGDLFGTPWCCCVAAPPQVRPQWTALGVRDCKTKMEEDELYWLDAAIRATPETAVVLAAIPVKEYNELMAKPAANLNRMLAWLHARALHRAYARLPFGEALLDRFGPEKWVPFYLARRNFRPAGFVLRQRPHAEDDILVAAASVCARAAYLRQLDALARAAGVPRLRRGCGPEAAEQGARILREKGAAVFAGVAKLHFKTARHILHRQPPENR